MKTLGKKFIVKEAFVDKLKLLSERFERNVYRRDDGTFYIEIDGKRETVKRRKNGDFYWRIDG